MGAAKSSTRLSSPPSSSSSSSLSSGDRHGECCHQGHQGHGGTAAHLTHRIYATLGHTPLLCVSACGRGAFVACGPPALIPACCHVSFADTLRDTCWGHTAGHMTLCAEGLRCSLDVKDDGQSDRCEPVFTLGSAC